MSPTTQTPTPTPSVSSVKVSFNNELRRFPFPIDASQDQFSVLYRTIAKSFGVERSSFVVQYVDDENDTVTIGSQLELSAALAVTHQSVLRLIVVSHHQQQPSTPSASSSLPSSPSSPSLPSSAEVDEDDNNNTKSTSQCHTYQHPNAHYAMQVLGRASGCGWRTPMQQQNHGDISTSSSPSPMHHHQGRGGRGGYRRMVGEQLQQQYREQLAQLEQEGLNCGLWAVRVLANVNGDVEAAKAFIRSRKGAMSDLKSKYASQLAELERLGVLESGSSSVSLSPPRHGARHSGAVEQHKQHGCLRKCVRLLEKFNGDVSQVVSHFERKRVERETLPTRYASELAELKAQGYWCEPVCLRLLNKFDGDVNKVVECMNKFKTRHQTSNATAIVTATSTEQSSVELKSKIERLVNKGYARPKCIRLLNKFGGNEQQVEQVLEARKQWFSEVKQHNGTIGCRRQALKEAKQRYATEISQLKEMGFKCKWLIVPLLVKHNGDVASVSLALSNNTSTSSSTTSTTAQ